MLDRNLRKEWIAKVANGRERLQTVTNGRKWPQTVANRHNSSQMVAIIRKLLSQLVANGRK